MMLKSSNAIFSIILTFILTGCVSSSNVYFPKVTNNKFDVSVQKTTKYSLASVPVGTYISDDDQTIISSYNKKYGIGMVWSHFASGAAASKQLSSDKEKAELDLISIIEGIGANSQFRNITLSNQGSSTIMVSPFNWFTIYEDDHAILFSGLDVFFNSKSSAKKQTRIYMASDEYLPIKGTSSWSANHGEKILSATQSNFTSLLKFLDKFVQGEYQQNSSIKYEKILIPTAGFTKKLKRVGEAKKSPKYLTELIGEFEEDYVVLFPVLPENAGGIYIINSKVLNAYFK